MPLTLTQIVFGLLLLYFGISYLASRLDNPLFEVVSRWVRWITFALTLAVLLAGEEPDLRAFAFWRIALAAFLLWFLLETVYNWLLISALSRSTIPLFPRFDANVNAEEWPQQRRFTLLRQWLRARGFRKLQSIRARLDNPIELRSSIYQSEDNVVRLQVLFIPKRPGVMQANYILSTCTREGERVITDNICLPYGGYYPGNWFLERHPLMQSLEKLLRLHRRRLLHGGVNVEHWPQEDEPLEELNRQQNELERLNTQAGFLVDLRDQETYGRLTTAGRYRLWKEIWLLKYFGVSL